MTTTVQLEPVLNFPYDDITRSAAEQIKLHMHASRRRQDASNLKDYKERAYGNYLGRRTLVGHNSSRGQVQADDTMLEALLTGARTPPSSRRDYHIILADLDRSRTSHQRACLIRCEGFSRFAVSILLGDAGLVLYCTK